jgi:hypothetical protein
MPLLSLSNADTSACPRAHVEDLCETYRHWLFHLFGKAEWDFDLGPSQNGNQTGAYKTAASSCASITTSSRIISFGSI